MIWKFDPHFGSDVCECDTTIILFLFMSQFSTLTPVLEELIDIQRYVNFDEQIVYYDLYGEFPYTSVKLPFVSGLDTV